MRRSRLYGGWVPTSFVVTHDSLRDSSAYRACAWTLHPPIRRDARSLVTANTPP
ncbi:MAG: hypothetical protein ACRC8Y_24120 [Chroococcales cyanobacterium]